MLLNLKKSIVFFDIESTGLNIVKDRIIEIALLKINPSGNQERLELLINPEQSIPKETELIHGISDEMVADKPIFKQVAKKIWDFIGNSDLSGYNIYKFDLPILAEEFLRVDLVLNMQERNIVDVQNIFHKMEPRTLSAAYKFYCKKEIINAHNAMADTDATYEVLLSQISMYANVKSEYGEVQNNIESLHKLSQFKPHVDIAGHIVKNEKNIPVFNFGKYKGQSVEEVFTKEPQYYDWIQKSNFPEYTKRTCQIINLKRLNDKNISMS